MYVSTFILHVILALNSVVTIDAFGAVWVLELHRQGELVLFREFSEQHIGVGER